MKRNLHLLLFLSLLLFQNCGGSKDNQGQEELKAVKYTSIEQAGGIVERSYSGVTQSSSLTNLSFRTGGLLVKLNAKVGQRVRKGSLLAQLDQKDAKLAYDQSQVDVQNAKVQYDAAASDFERTKQLYETENASLSDYERAKSTYSNAESSYEISLKRLDLQQSQVDYTSLISPMTGVISEVRSEINEVIRSGSTIIVMSSEANNDIQAQVGVPEKYINDIKIGDPVSVSIQSIDQTFKGSVAEVAYSSSSTGVTYPVTVAIESKGNKNLRPGMPAEVQFQFGTADQKAILVAPLKAVASGVEGNYLFKLVSEGDAFKAIKVAVEVGEITQSGYEIKSGVSEGDIVAVAGLSFLYEGKKVKLLEN